MKKSLLVTALLLMSATAYAKKDCEELKAEIAAKIKANGVSTFTLEIVAADAPEDGGKVVGTCDGGQKKIVYKR